MQALRISAILTALSLALFVLPLASGEEEDFDRTITQELQARNPVAAHLFTTANLARQSGNHKEAAELFSRVTAMVPDFSHAWRREGYELLALDRRDEALSKMQHAIALERSPWNMAGLAAVLATGAGTSQPSEVDLNEAESLVRQAEAMKEDATLSFLACQLALQKQEYDW